MSATNVVHEYPGSAEDSFPAPCSTLPTRARTKICMLALLILIFVDGEIVLRTRLIEKTPSLVFNVSSCALIVVGRMTGRSAWILSFKANVV